MKKKYIKKGLPVVIIILFFGICIAPSINSKIIDIEPSDKNGTKNLNEKGNDSESISGWKTYRFCFIFGEFYLDMFPNIIWFGPFPIVKCCGILDVTLNGLKGKVEPREFIGFGFRGFIYPYIEPRYRGSIEGYFRLCLYKE